MDSGMTAMGMMMMMAWRMEKIPAPISPIKATLMQIMMGLVMHAMETMITMGNQTTSISARDMTSKP
jgi:hypothetical protein